MAIAGSLNFLAADASGISAYWGWIVVGAFIVIGLLLIGRRDVVRFSIKRTWAISGVCFAESIRRKVLWLTPLAMIAVILITQFERALDEEEALRQTVKFCLFATGTVIMLTSVILACTNLPKEIESRVIYTIATKPTTRLEIILGKIVGFSRVSLTILLIMGLFTWGYLRLRGSEKNNEIALRLQDGNINDAERARLIAYQQAGLLSSRSFSPPYELQVFGEKPDPANPQMRVLGGSGDQDLFVGYRMDHKYFFGDPPASQDPDEWAHQGVGENGLLIRVELDAQRTAGTPNDQPEPVASPVLGPGAPATQASPAHLLQPYVAISLVDENHYDLIAQKMIGGTDIPTLASNMAEYYKSTNGSGAVPQKLGASAIRLTEPRKTPGGRLVQFAYAWVPPETAAELFSHPAFYIRITGNSAHVDYQVGEHPVRLYIPQIVGGVPQLEPPAATEIPASADRFGHPQLLMFAGKTGLRLDQQIDGGPDHSAVADYSFGNSPSANTSDQAQTTFQFTPLVNRADAQIVEGDDDPTTVDIDVVDNDAKKISAGTSVQVETNRPAYFSVPSSSLGSGNFELLFHCRNTGQTVGLQPQSVELISGIDSFEFNLIKGLAIIWLMSILVISISIFSSTFLSWPIAIVLTLVLLVGRWGVTQLADTNTAGLGRQIVNDFKFTDAAVSSVVSSSVDALSKGLNTLALVLPDLSRFDAIDDLQNGISVSATRIDESIWGLLGFAVPAIIAAYVILKNKEVAP